MFVICSGNMSVKFICQFSARWFPFLGIGVSMGNDLECPPWLFVKGTESGPFLFSDYVALVLFFQRHPRLFELAFLFPDWLNHSLLISIERTILQPKAVT